MLTSLPSYSSFFQPYLARKFKITDTCGVNNLHGMPAILGGLLSVFMAGIATKDQYDQFNIDREDPERSSLVEIFPEMKADDWTGGTQAGMQLAAMVVTLVFAVVGGFLTGMFMRWFQPTMFTISLFQATC